MALLFLVCLGYGFSFGRKTFIDNQLTTIPANSASGIWHKLDSLENRMKIAIMQLHSFFDINEKWLLNSENIVPSFA